MDNQLPEYYQLVDGLIGMACQFLHYNNVKVLDDLSVSAGQIAIEQLKSLGLVENGAIISKAFNIEWLKERFSTKCKDCPHDVGDSYKRDCAYPDCINVRDPLKPIPGITFTVVGRHAPPELLSFMSDVTGEQITGFHVDAISNYKGHDNQLVIKLIATKASEKCP